MSGNFYYVKIVFSGDAMSLGNIKGVHLPNNDFDLNSIQPMPRELDMDFTNLVELGHAALYGEWQSVAKYGMFKEPAEKLGYPFPLESRDQVIRSLESFDCADSYLAPARQYQENLDKFGHGTRTTWREKHWGTRDNAQGVKTRVADDTIILWFVSDKYPSQALKKLSADYPGLDFLVLYADDSKRYGQQLAIKNGKEAGKQKLSPMERSDLILEYTAA